MPRKHRTPESLALNRENQRRSRARHRELLEELQGRVRDYERRDAQATLDMQRVAREVAAENAALKALLAGKGVAPEEVEAHLQAARATVQAQAAAPQALPQLMPLSVRDEMPERRDMTGSEPPLRQVYYDPRLDMPHQQPSRTSSISSSSMTAPPIGPASISNSLSRPLSASASTSSRASPIAIAPKPLLRLHPTSPSLSVTIPPLSSVVPTQHPPQLINEHLQLPPVKFHNYSGNQSSAMDLDQPAGISRPQLQHNPAGFSRPAPNQKAVCCLNPQTGESSTCRVLPSPQQPAQGSSALETSNKMRCVEAAAILARLRGHPDERVAWAALGCSDNEDCVVRKSDLLQLMDEMA
ncbi:hypothetical protein B0J13DRAFT_3505 [Dactylonectria estremocensis]|uniref:BZIP domain-containing protein n=1 Tax=Dactylonectria estremocensis TaxID=1079267 RepID=A0A9P9FIN6_9HYPO|nr:hypothetical protein B0J13DRAFT_3505 [Dactylonectria estremocensis]